MFLLDFCARSAKSYWRILTTTSSTPSSPSSGKSASSIFRPLRGHFGIERSLVFSSQQKFQYVAIIWENKRSLSSWPSIMTALFVLIIMIILVTINLITCAQAPPCETMMSGKVGDPRLPQKYNRRLRRRPNRLFARCRLWKGCVKGKMTCWGGKNWSIKNKVRWC